MIYPFPIAKSFHPEWKTQVPQTPPQRMWLWIFAVGLLATATGISAQSYSINWSTINGGGGTSRGGGYSISGTVGQAHVGTLTGGPYSVVGGFWSAVQAIQSPSAPLLSLHRDRTSGQITVLWPLPATGFILEETSDLGAGQDAWTPVSPSLYQTNATDIFITVDPSNHDQKYYRLYRP